MKKIINVFLFFIVSTFIGVKEIGAQELVKLPTMVMGEDKFIVEPIDGDLVAAGKNIVVSTDINGDAYVAGGKVIIDGTINGDLVVAGGEVVIKGLVAKNLIAAGGKITTEDMAMVEGYVLAAGGEIILNGQFDGPVKVAGGRLTTTESTFVTGDLIVDTGEVQGIPLATVDGDKKINVYQVNEYQRGKIRSGMESGGTIFGLMSGLATMTVLMWIFGKQLTKRGGEMEKMGVNLGWGLVVMAVTPLLIILLLLSMVGVPLGLILVPLYVIAIYISWFVSAAAVGDWIRRQGWVKSDNKYWLGIMGLLVLYILGWTPWIGGIFKTLALLMGLGIMFRTTREKLI